MAVAEEVPYTVEVIQPKVPMVQNGLMDVKVKVTRKGDFKGPITVRQIWDPPGVGSGQVTIKPEENEGVLTINAQGGARVGKWQTGLLASADITGATWLASNPYTLDVANPYLAATVDRASVVQGSKVTVTVKLEQKTPFEGKAKIQLLGLPNEATTVEKEITKDDKEVAFEVQTTDKTPAATHKGLLCRVTVVQNGEPIQHNLGNGGILRVDPLKKPTPPAGGKPVAAVK